MVIQAIAPTSKETMDEYVAQAARAAGYEKGFGIPDCDLSKPMPTWWAAYCRQSLDQQTQNNRLPEYLFTMAKIAREQGVVVPREYIFYDHATGEHLDRPEISFLRHELIHKQKVVGVIFADLRCLSREPAPQQVFERECEILGVRLLYGDAPSGMDIGSQFARSALTFSNKLTRLATNRNARAGNVGRVLKGWVPSTKAAYGYSYRRDAEITQDGKVRIKRAWWEANELDPGGNPVPLSPADTVINIFTWIGNERRTSYWVTEKLNQLGIKAPSGGLWSPGKVYSIVYNHCYTGKHTYNAKMRVPNPKRPLGDVTGAVKRTLLRPKPEGEAVEFTVPALVSEEVWQKANQVLQARGRGRGKQGKTILALLRGRIFCPRCGKPMVVRRKSGKQVMYYHCSRHYRSWSPDRCTYRGFVPSSWDEMVWDCTYALLIQDTWLEEYLSSVENQAEDVERLIKSEQQKMLRANAKIGKIREGFEAGIYGIDDAKFKIAGCQDAIKKAEDEIRRIREQVGKYSNSEIDIDTVRQELKQLATINLEEATFEEKRDIISKLGIRVYPSEDLKTMRVKCGLKLTIEGDNHGSVGEDGCGIVMFGLPRSRSQPVSGSIERIRVSSHESNRHPDFMVFRP
ncbi:recombinase family protein [Chloroflexota bacterium]